MISSMLQKDDDLRTRLGQKIEKNPLDIFKHFDFGLCELYYDGINTYCSLRHIAVVLSNFDVYKHGPGHYSKDRYDKYSKYINIYVPGELCGVTDYKHTDISFYEFIGRVLFMNNINFDEARELLD